MAVIFSFVKNLSIDFVYSILTGFCAKCFHFMVGPLVFFPVGRHEIAF
ncbi:hypothetical protein BVI2075_230010 [Burkholderia vietnamiensis]|nr:hypothetical protein BVI2075_230010 [Burkholderia vietnamiensis]